MDEEGRLQQRAAISNLVADLGQSSSRAIETLTGAPSSGVFEAQRQRANDPLKAFHEFEQRKMAKTSAAKPQKTPVDPNGPEVKSLQEFARSRWPQEPDAVILAITPERFESIRKTLDAKYGIQSREGLADKQIDATDERARLEREQRSRIWAQKMGLEYDKMSLQERLATDRIAEAVAAREAKTSEAERKRQEERSVPGFEPAPGATPTADDAKKMKDTNEAALRMHGNIADLRALHQKYGSTPKGAGAELQQQKLRAIQIEAKNIAGLGALSGPDFNLMQDLSAQDVNSIQYWIQRNFVGASLEESLKGLEQWMRTTIDATAKARGYTAAKPGPRRVPVSKGLPKGHDGQPTLDAPDDTVRVILNGKPKRVPRANLDALKKLAAEKTWTLEVPGG
jgi:hypothetical protein